MAELMDVARAAAGRMGEWLPDTAALAGEASRGGPSRLSVDLYRGPYRKADLIREGARTPTVRVAVLRVVENRNAGAEDLRDPGAAGVALPGAAFTAPARRRVRVDYGASIIARGLDGRRGPDQVAEAIGTALLRLVPDEQWGLDGVDGAEAVTLVNTFDEDFAEARMSLWNLGWTQEVLLGEPVPGGKLPARLFVTESIRGAVVARNQELEDA